MSGLVTVERDGPVVTAVLNRPGALNALNVPLALELHEALKAIQADPGVRAAILTGAGRAFCAGGDVRDMAANVEASGGGCGAYLATLVEPLHALVRTLVSMEKPVVAAVNGTAAGAGAALALACAFRVVSADARFVGAYLNIGLTPDGGAPWLLARLAGVQKTRDFFLLDDAWDSETLLKNGVAQRISEPGKALETALALARRLAARPAWAVGKTLGLIDAAQEIGFDAHLDLQETIIRQAGDTPDCREGIRAFVAKRKPKFNAEPPDAI